MILNKIANKKQIFAWSLYDFANQPFSTIIVTFIYGPFFIEYIANDRESGDSLWAFSISLTAIVVSFLSPFLGSISDRGGYRKIFLLLFTLIASIFSMLLFFPSAGDVFLALSIFTIANISFELGHVFYNSYLMDITNKDSFGKVSGFAWGLGFFGGLLALFLSIMLFPEIKDLDPFGVEKVNFLIGCWFIFFSLPLFLFINEEKKSIKKIDFLESYRSIASTFNNISNYKKVFSFLLARLFYNDALITIFALGGIYASETLGFSIYENFILGIVLSLSAGIGSIIFGFIEDKIGFKKVINISLIVLILATLLAFIAPVTNFEKQLFWIAGVLMGLMIGPNQSCSRSLMSRLTPVDKKNEFFGFFAFTGKATSFIGPLIFGLISFYYSQQFALLIIVFLFLVGLILFNKIRFDEE